MGKLIVIAIAAALAVGSIGSQFVQSRDSQPTEPIALAADGRRDDVDVELATEESEGDGDDTEGVDGTNGGDNTRPPAPEAVEVGDGGGTPGDDGTKGGEDTFVRAPAPSPVRLPAAQAAPAPAPAPARAPARVDVDTDDGTAGGGDT